jgi:hypothetical protein
MDIPHFSPLRERQLLLTIILLGSTKRVLCQVLIYFLDYGYKDGYDGKNITCQEGGNNAKAIFHI